MKLGPYNRFCWYWMWVDTWCVLNYQATNYNVLSVNIQRSFLSFSSPGHTTPLRFYRLVRCSVNKNWERSVARSQRGRECKNKRSEIKSYRGFTCMVCLRWQGAFVKTIAMWSVLRLIRENFGHSSTFLFIILFAFVQVCGRFEDPQFTDSIAGHKRQNF